LRTASTDERPDKTAVAGDLPTGWILLDNSLFRYTMGIPPTWYTDTRPEGGAFRLFDETKTNAIATGKGGHGPGGIVGSFSAREAVTDVPPEFTPVIERHLGTPNASFGAYPGAIWEEDGHGAATMNGAFIRDGIVYEIHFNIEERGRTPGEILIGIQLAKDIIATIRPF
jgi:hypothetical protein